MNGKLMSKVNNSLISIDQRMERVRILSGNNVKMIAIVTMVVDHFSKIVLSWLSSEVWFPLAVSGEMPQGEWQQIDEFIRFKLYGIGTIAFPLFCFLLAEGFRYTSSRKRYCLLMAAFAVVSEIPFDLAFFSSDCIEAGTYPFFWMYQNVFFTLLLGLLAVWGIEIFQCQAEEKAVRIKNIVIQTSCVLAAASLADLIYSDYGSQGVLFIVGFYVAGKNRLYQITIFLLLYIITTGNQPPIYTMMSCVAILFYNGKRGKWRHKYFFYWFYPVHLAVLFLMTIWLDFYIKR